MPEPQHRIVNVGQKLLRIVRRLRRARWSVAAARGRQDAQRQDQTRHEPLEPSHHALLQKEIDHNSGAGCRCCQAAPGTRHLTGTPHRTPHRHPAPGTYNIVMTEPAYPAARAIALRSRSNSHSTLRPRARSTRTSSRCRRRPTSRRSSTPRSGRACGARKGTSENLARAPAAGARRPAAALRASLPLASPALVKVAPAVERRGIHLGVWRRTASCTCGARPHFRSSVRPRSGGAGPARHQAPPRRGRASSSTSRCSRAIKSR